MVLPSTTVGLPALLRKSVPKFDHAAFYPTIRAGDVFLCSYPKSGATWLGLMIAHVIKPQENEALNLKSFNIYVPDVNLAYTQQGSLAALAHLGDPRFFLCNATADRQLPKVVYMVRDPRDVMVSYWHYRHFLERDFKLSLAEFLSGDDHWPCEWDDHVASWMLTPRPHPNLLVVRYEDVHKDAAAVLRGVLDFAGVKCGDGRLEAAIESARFENMRAAEEKFGVNGEGGHPDERLVRRGRVGSWQEEMGYAELRIIEQKYGSVMQAVGYEPLS